MALSLKESEFIHSVIHMGWEQMVPTLCASQGSLVHLTPAQWIKGMIWAKMGRWISCKGLSIFNLYIGVYRFLPKEEEALIIVSSGFVCIAKGWMLLKVKGQLADPQDPEAMAAGLVGFGVGFCNLVSDAQGCIHIFLISWSFPSLSRFMFVFA